MNTLILDLDRWDLVVDASGNVAMATAPYALAQDAASAIRLFATELWYDTLLGIPYPTSILGKDPPLNILKARFVAAALTVPGVVSAEAFITALNERDVSGQIQVTDADGVVSIAGF